MFGHILRCKVLRHEVSGVVRTCDLGHCERSSPDSLLHPEVLHGDVTQFAQTLTLHDAQGRAGISVELCVKVDAKVSGQGDEADRLAGALCQSVQL